MQMILIISSILLWFATSLNLVLTLALVRYVKLSPSHGFHPQEIEPLKVGELAPNFAAEDLKGQIVTQASYLGCPHVMVFVSPDCTACTSQMPILEELYSKSQNLGINLVIISLASVESTRRYVQQLNFSAPILAAPKSLSSFRTDYKVPGTPSYYVINSDGKIMSGGFFDDNWREMIASWNSPDIKSVFRKEN